MAFGWSQGQFIKPLRIFSLLFGFYDYTTDVLRRHDRRLETLTPRIALRTGPLRRRTGVGCTVDNVVLLFYIRKIYLYTIHNRKTGNTQNSITTRIRAVFRIDD